MPGTSITSDIPNPVSSRACLVSNTDSGANLKCGLSRVEKVALAAGLRHHTIDNDTMATLKEVLGECARRGDRLIIVNAGDGTVCRILEHIRNDRLFPTEPAFALLRGGTTNMIHNDVGVPGRPETALQALLESLTRRRCAVLARHVLRVDNDSRSEPWYGFFLGTNAVVKGIQRTRRKLHRRVSTGPLSELLSVGVMIWRLIRRRIDQDPVLSPVSIAFSRDDDPWQQTSHVLLMAMSVQKAILGIRPLRQGQRAGVAILKSPDYQLVPWVRDFLTGRLEAFDTISLRGEFGWILDGEIREHTAADGALVIRVDKPANFLVPAS